MFEIQKIEELKQEIDKSKSLKEYIMKEISELEERLQNLDSENKQNLIEYKIKKQELEQKLFKLKNEMLNEEALNQEERNKYNQIENDIKNKISFVSLQNSNISTGSVKHEDEYNPPNKKRKGEQDEVDREKQIRNNRKISEREESENYEDSNKSQPKIEDKVQTQNKNRSNLRNAKSKI